MISYIIACDPTDTYRSLRFPRTAITAGRTLVFSPFELNKAGSNCFGT